MAIILPLLFVFSPLLPDYRTFLLVLHIVVAGVGTLFIVNFKMRKLSAKELALLVIEAGISLAIIVFAGRSWWKMLHFISRR